MKQNLEQMYRRALDLRAPWLTRWDSALRYTMPRADDEAATLFDATAADAADNLAASIYSLLTPPESLWLSLVPESAQSPDAVDATMALRANLNDSNFYTTIHQCYMDLIVLGTACLFMAENPIGAASAFSFTAIPMRDIAVLNGAVFHMATMPAREVMERYPTWTPPANLRDTIKNDPETPLRLVQSLVGTDFTAWLDVGGDIENNIVSTGKFETNPYIIFRWAVASGEQYGRGPVLRALPDIKTANKVVELVLKNATIAVSGIWQADDDGVINLANINLTPGAIIPKAVGSSGLTPLASGANFDVSQIVLKDLRERIRHALLADRLGLLSEKEMTATEIMARNADMMRILGATYGRLLHEFIRPLVERGLQILSRRGVIDKISLHSDAELKYIAPIAQMAIEETVL
ncbi:MAG: phage tail protein [Proteobacteria bacterium]|uniref:Phage tail protein n=1 Tax=Candidatus Enterousia avistercoris TaxID=2840788 RepID=A0A9D9GV17_9PROT|nr:phage tail protein [Candidatus Enterousia avistercoris]